MTSYYTQLFESDLTPRMKAYYHIDQNIRRIGYIPIIGSIVGIPRMCIGVSQQIISKEGDYQGCWNEGNAVTKVTYTGDKLRARGKMNVTRGMFEVVGIFTFLYDCSMESAYGKYWSISESVNKI